MFAEIESLPVAQVMCVCVHNAVDDGQDGDAMNIMTAVTDKKRQKLILKTDHQFITSV